jgi:hypothetical protein
MSGDHYDELAPAPFSVPYNEEDAHHEHDAAAAAANNNNNSHAGLSNSNISSNKWSKNGYGLAVARASGKFTPQESDLCRRAVEDYCSLKNITTARLCSECDHKAELKGAWMEIAKKLPHRSVQSVYRHGIRQLHPFQRGAWSEQECILLSDLVVVEGKKWSLIQGKLNRSADSCRDKYREMNVEYVKGRWKDQEVERLKALIRIQVISKRESAGGVVVCVG